MSAVQYGPETLKYCKIVDYHARTMLSDDGIDYLCTEIRCTVQGIVSNDLEDFNLSVLCARIKANLMIPRQPLTIYLGESPNDDKVIEVVAPDMRGGPRCEDVGFMNFYGQRSCIVQATFVAYVTDCPTPNEPPILSNRWSVTHTVGENYMLQQTYQGRLIINPRNGNINADFYRQYCFRDMPKGMKPVSADFRQSTDGLTLDYTVVFVEQYQLPPGELTTIDVDYGESTSNGAVTYADMTIRAFAPKGVTKKSMLATCMTIVLSRFNLRIAAALNGQDKEPEKDVLIDAQIREKMSDNSVTVHIRTIKTQARLGLDPNGNVMVGPLDNTKFGRPMPFVPNAVTPGNAQIWGTANERAVAAAWRSYACNPADRPIGAKGPGGTPDSATGPNFTFGYQAITPKSQSEVSDEARTNPYSEYGHATEYETKHGKVFMPYGEQKDGDSSESPKKSGEFVSVHPPYTTRRVRFKAERHRDWPKVPAATVVSENGQMIVSSVEAVAPELQSDQQGYKYTVSGTLVSIHGHDAEEYWGGVYIGKSPATNLSVDDGKFPAEKRSEELIENP